MIIFILIVIEKQRYNVLMTSINANMSKDRSTCKCVVGMMRMKSAIKAIGIMKMAITMIMRMTMDLNLFLSTANVSRCMFCSDFKIIHERVWVGTYIFLCRQCFNSRNRSRIHPQFNTLTCSVWFNNDLNPVPLYLPRSHITHPAIYPDPANAQPILAIHASEYLSCSWSPCKLLNHLKSLNLRPLRLQFNEFAIAEYNPTTYFSTGKTESRLTYHSKSERNCDFAEVLRAMMNDLEGWFWTIQKSWTRKGKRKRKRFVETWGVIA